jgi:hypothetical protein
MTPTVESLWGLLASRASPVVPAKIRLSEIHRPHLLTHDLPIVVAVVDSEENIKRLLPVVEEIVATGLIAMSDVEVFQIQSKAGKRDV